MSYLLGTPASLGDHMMLDAAATLQQDLSSWCNSECWQPLGSAAAWHRVP